MLQTFVSYYLKRAIMLFMIVGLALPQVLWAQSDEPKTITGTVKDEEGEPLHNASVYNDAPSKPYLPMKMENTHWK